MILFLVPSQNRVKIIRDQFSSQKLTKVSFGVKLRTHHNPRHKKNIMNTMKNSSSASSISDQSCVNMNPLLFSLPDARNRLPSLSSSRILDTDLFSIDSSPPCTPPLSKSCIGCHTLEIIEKALDIVGSENDKIPFLPATTKTRQ
jgi:hypothetical protein